MIEEAATPSEEQQIHPKTDEMLLPYEIDPAAPLQGEVDRDFDAARDAANYGDVDPKEHDAAEEAREAQAREPLTATELNIDWAKVQAFLHACVTSNPRVGYRLGAKIPSDASVPGRDFKHVDCSGFVRRAIRRSTSPTVAFPDGSVVQHDWVRAGGFPAQTVADGKLRDGKIRIAFLRRQDSPKNIGHVVLIRNGRTVESHSGVGPNSRPFDGSGWQAKAKVYLLRG